MTASPLGVSERRFYSLTASSGREHIVITYSVRKPTTGTQPPSLFDKCHGIFYMPSRIDTDFDYPCHMDHSLPGPAAIEVDLFYIIRDGILPGAGFEPMAVIDLLITSGTPYRSATRAP